MRIIVTGASGFVGAHVAEALRGAGHEVVTWVRSEVAQGSASPEHAAVDLADLRAMSVAMRRFDAVVHAAGTSSLAAPEAVLGWLEAAATENVVRAARHAGVRRLVTFSTTDVTLASTVRDDWGEVRSVARPVSAFGRVARVKEEATIGAGSRDFEPIVLRAGLLYGPGDRTRAPRLVREARDNGALRVVGRALTFIPTTYVANLAAASVCAVESRSGAHGIYHVLDRELTTQRPFLERLSEALRLPAPHIGRALWAERLRARLSAGDATLDEAEVLRRGISSRLDTRRAKDELGFVAPHPQEEGLLALARWVDALGGPDALTASARPAPDEASVARLRSAAY